jgi:hypothetical protein
MGKPFSPHTSQPGIESTTFFPKIQKQQDKLELKEAGKASS